MQNTHSRDDIRLERVTSAPSGDAFGWPIAWSGEEENIKLRDQLLKAYPLPAPKPVYVVRDDLDDEYAVFKVTNEVRPVMTCIADSMTEEHAQVLADAMNVRAQA